MEVKGDMSITARALLSAASLTAIPVPIERPKIKIFSSLIFRDLVKKSYTHMASCTQCSSLALDPTYVPYPGYSTKKILQLIPLDPLNKCALR